ncbi:MAG: limonene-1,2-epoxide hydrolase [Acidimicrobiales bacterium]|jgi:limonene-1,2-epoxide hydrolase
MMSSERVEIVKGVMEAWSRHDIDGVVAFMADDVLWHYHVGSKPVSGRDGMARFLTKLSAHQQQLDWKLVRAAENADAVLLEGTDDYVNPSGHHVQAPYMGIFEFDADNRVTAWRDYVEMATMAIGEKGEPLPEFLQSLVDRPAV